MLKEQSIGFVQEILVAKTTGDDEKLLGQRVEDLKDFIREDLMNTYASIWSFDRSKNKLMEDPIYGRNLDLWASTAKKSWLNGKKTIAFVGEFSAGKTSIVNRILSQDQSSVPLLPVSTKATTAIPTYISGADTPSYRFVSPSDDIKTISETTFRKVNKEILDEVKGVSNLIKYFVMRYKNPLLNGLSILDTPGFSSSDKEDALRTIEVINECDALFWVFDVNAGTVNRSSIKLIKENLSRPIYVVINKVDTKSKVEVDQVENYIKQTLNNAGIKVQGYVRFSEKAPLQNIMKPIQNVQHVNERENYLDTLLSVTEQWRNLQNNDVEDAQATAVKLDNKYSKLRDKFKRLISELHDDCQEAAGIPHFETTYMGLRGRFEMKEPEYNRLMTLLNRLMDQRSKDLKDEFNNMKSTVKDLENAWKQVNDEKNNKARLDNCIEILTKKISAVRSAAVVNGIKK